MAWRPLVHSRRGGVGRGAARPVPGCCLCCHGCSACCCSPPILYSRRCTCPLPTTISCSPPVDWLAELPHHVHRRPGVLDLGREQCVLRPARRAPRSGRRAGPGVAPAYASAGYGCLPHAHRPARARSPVASTIIFIAMFDPDNGLINALLQQVGLPTVGWLTDPTWSKPALILLSLWGSAPAP